MRVGKTSNLGFAVIKLSFDGDVFYVLRKNDRWRDYNFIGGHVEGRDGGDFEKTARREFYEEFPTGRSIAFDAMPLTPLLKYGPTFSKSAETTVLYYIAFFCIKFRSNPLHAIESISVRSSNRLVAEEQILQRTMPITRFAELLNSKFDGGIRQIPKSWETDLPFASKYESLLNNDQYDLDFDGKGPRLPRFDR